MGFTQAVYDRLPPVLRTGAVSAYGAWLLAWRVGPGYEACRRQALQRDGWSAEELADWQRGRLAHVLERAATRVPYYRRRWEGSMGSPWTRLREWPLLAKSSVRSEPRSFLVDGRSSRLMLRARTSGSTGSPLTMWRSRRTTQRWYALFEARALSWHGVAHSDRWATIGGPLVTPVSQSDPPFWAWDAPQRLLVLSAYHLAPGRARAYVEEMGDRRVRYILGYASALYSLACFALDEDVQVVLPDLRVVVSSAEPLYPHMRETITRAFGCPVFDTYRMVEMVAAASECDEGGLHLWPEVGYVEVLKDDTDEPVEPGEVGRLICTGLLNEDMPLVRYEVGDRGALSTEPCPCGRSLPVLETIEGRLDDVIVLADGRRVGRFGAVFWGDIPLREAQVVQESVDLVRVLVVPEPGFSDETEQLIRGRMHDRLGDGVGVRVEPVESIPRGPNGKFRGVISRVPNSRASDSRRQS